MGRTIIIGGVAGGASAATRLRRMSETEEIILLEKGGYISFANCGLPYHVGNVIKEKSKLEVMAPERLKKRFNIDVRVLNKAIKIDPGKKEVEVKNLLTNTVYTELYDTCVVATGTSAIIEKYEGVPDERNYLVRDIPQTARLETDITSGKIKSAAVIGGGFMGIEVAENLQMRGVKTNLIEREKQIFAVADEEMAKYLQQKLEDNSIRVHLNTTVEKAQLIENKVELQLDNATSITVDAVVMCVGIKPNSKIGQEAGLEINAFGAIVVDENMRTSDPYIYAAGDVAQSKDAVTKEVVRRYLAGPANKQGRQVANAITGSANTFAGTLGSSVIQAFDGVLALTGYNERQLKARNEEYGKVYTHSADHATYYPGAKDIAMKLLYAKADGKILGAQAFGQNGVEKRIDVIATAIYAGLTVFDLERLDLCYAPPFSSAKDPVNVAGYCAANILRGDVAAFQYDEVKNLIDERAYILDVRTKKEFDEGHIDTAINISVDDLRGRLSEIPQDRPVYVYCRVGLRGYLACRILMQNGFNALNLTGGWKTYLQR